MIEEVVDFFFENCPYLGCTKEEFAEAIKKHIEYGTFVCLRNETGIIGATNFNIDKNTAHILNSAVKPEVRNKDVLKEMLLFGLKKFPQVTHLRFDSIKTKKTNIEIPVEWITGKKE